MSEGLDKAYEREYQKQQNASYKGIVIQTYHDIISVVNGLSPKLQTPNDVTVKAEIEFDNHTHSLSIPSKSLSKRDLLINIINKTTSLARASELLEQNNIHNAFAGTGSYDTLVAELTGGYLDGTYICWDVGGLHYYYDIQNHRLMSDVNSKQ